VIIPYTAQPHGATPRPLLDVTLGEAGFDVKALIDSGAVNTLFDESIADAAGISLEGAEVRELGVGRATVSARFAEVAMTAAGHAWEAPIGFCRNWQPGWGLLGHDSFLRFFTITFRAADLQFELHPIDA